MNAFEHSNCPMCDANNAERIRTSGDIVKCNACNLVYLRTRPTIKELEEHYQKYASNPGSHMRVPTSSNEVKNSGLRRDYFLTEIVAYTGAKRGNMLDLGSGWGAFLDNARDNGFNPFGVEICAEMAEFSRTIKIPTWSNQLENISFNDGSFQVVTMLHAFEHMPNQRRTLGRLHNILQPEGYLCGIVPNFNSFCSTQMGDKWCWLDPEMHYVQWTVETLTKALWLCGFNTLKMYTKTGDFDRNVIVRELEKHHQMPNLPTGNAAAMIESLEKQGQGEEIRFFASKI